MRPYNMLQRIKPENAMSSPMMDTSVARGHMVDSQIRPNKVTHAALLAAFRAIARERFVPAAATARAYADDGVALGGGRVLMAPMWLARLLQAARPAPGERARVVGCGTGYGAAVLAACGLAVTALDEDESLLAIGRAAAPAGVRFVTGKLAAGWQDAAPYDVIVIEGAAEAIPEALGAQLVPATGRLVAVREEAGLGRAVLGEVFDGRLAFTTLFDCPTPVLPAFKRAPQFVF